MNKFPEQDSSHTWDSWHWGFVVAGVVFCGVVVGLALQDDVQPMLLAVLGLFAVAVLHSQLLLPING